MSNEYVVMKCDSCDSGKTFQASDRDKWNHYTEFEITPLNTNGVYSGPVLLCRNCYSAETKTSSLAKIVSKILKAR